LPEALVADIDAEARARKLSRSDIVCRRLRVAANAEGERTAAFAAIADLIGSADGLPADLSARKKHYLKAIGFGRKRAR
jgi:hypothetical protein